ncbi:MAG: histidine kinase [Salinisphaeraceae bacterium]|nr:histidine kinase [Salinisphaeraceae bacterium]
MLDIDKLDFERCEDEPIHIPESIQGYGYLFALDCSSARIEIVSENIETLLRDGADVVGENFFELLDPDSTGYDFLEETYQRARTKGTRLPVRVQFRPERVFAEGREEFLAVVYDSDGRFVVELEPASSYREVFSAQHYLKLYAITVAPKFKLWTTIDEVAQEIVDTIRYVTGMDRVVLYKFNEDDSGQVIAEAKCDEVESYLDLFYPASDIPPQARELYKKNWVRLTPDVELPPSRLLPTMQDTGREPLDLTHSVIRSLSPIHQQYIRNQGLRASMSMSLVTHDKLWGLISCHHREPRYLPQNVRLECEKISQLFSWHLYAKEEEIFFKKKQAADQAVNRMLAEISADHPISDVFRENEAEVLRILDADGFVFYSHPQIVTIGATPDIDLVRQVYRASAATMASPFKSAELHDVTAYGHRFGEIKGMLIIPLLEEGEHFTAWFRRERRIKQKWAGVPQEDTAAGSKKDRLMPRASFEVHHREVTGRSKEWDQADLDMADRFNRVFMAYALETQRKMRRNLSDLEKQDRYRNEFLATLAHELRNPLAPISTGISVLKKRAEQPNMHEIIDRMERQMGSLTLMIDDLMDASRVTRGKVHLNLQVLPIQQVLSEVVSNVTTLVEQKQHHFSTDMPDEPLYVNGDATRLSQVFFNLLNNAVKYTDPGGRIHLQVRDEQDGVAVAVIDNGVGIEPEKVDMVFTMFTQIDAASPRTQGGLGVGLTLAERLVQQHGGSISAWSEGLGRGAQFKVLLPHAELEESAQPPSEPASTRVPGQGRGKVLIVDDVEDIVAAYSLLLIDEGYDCETATSAGDAITVFERFAPDIALLDIGMPDMDGFQLCKHLKGLPGGDHCVFLAQSGWAKEQDLENSREVGFADHLVKPFDPEQLLEKLAMHLDKG